MRRLLARAAVASALAACAYVGSEWLFFVTKPSMFSALTWPNRVGILLGSIAPATILTVASALALAAIAGLLARRLAPFAAALPAALVGGATVLLLVENFTKTLFGFNIGDATSAGRYFYLAGLIAVVAFVGWRLARVFQAPRGGLERGLTVGVSALLLAAVLVTGLRYRRGAEAGDVVGGPATERFNVLLLSSDGIDANRTSVYGYARKTTPFLESRRDELLLLENHFSNSANTAAANAALLSGKLPTTTGVVEQLDAFQGTDVYQHLPGVLRQMGYYGIQVGARQYADAHAQNLRNAFDVANGRRLDGRGASLVARYGRSYPAERYFLELSLERLVLRLRHAAGRVDLNEIVAPVGAVQPSWSSDRGRVDALLDEIRGAPRPFFAHVHLLDSHGPIFRPARQHFSSGKRQTVPFERDFLDDAIAGFDSYVEEIFAALEADEELDRTLIVISSDHGLYWSTTSRMPLLIRFPEVAIAGSSPIATQTIDIAPTVLDYLGVETPAWLEGQSILAPERDSQRPFISTGKTANDISLLQCQKWHRLDLVTGALQEGLVVDHTAPCDEQRLFDARLARREMMAAIDGSSLFERPLFIGQRLGDLTQRPDPAARRELIDDILGGAEQIHYLDEDTLVVRTHWDFWTRGDQPAGIVVRNRGDDPISKRVRVSSSRGREFPLSFYLEDGETTRQLTFSGPGNIEAELGPVGGGSERLFILWAAKAWTPGPQDRRPLGVKLSLPP